MHKGAKDFIDDQFGAMAVTVALFLVVLLAVAALAVDYGYMAWVQGELQKAAEAGALAGARALVPYTGAPLQPNWSQAQTVATQTVLLNRADAQFLTDCQVQSGYWSLTAKTLRPGHQQNPCHFRCPCHPGGSGQDRRQKRRPPPDAVCPHLWGQNL